MASKECMAGKENLEEILAEIKSLRQDDANGKWDIRLCGIEYTHIRSRAILQAFHHCSRNRINFGCLHIDGLYGEALEMERVFLDANRLSLFTLIEVDAPILSEDATFTMFDGFPMNQRLQSITLSGGAFTRYSSKSLRRCLESNGQLQYLALTASRFFRDAAMILAAGLKANTTLQAIRLATMFDDSVGHLAKLVTALTGHPKLTSFKLVGFILHDEAGRALEQLLSAPNCKIEWLVLPRIELETSTGHVYRGLKQCKFLERITIFCNATFFKDLFGNAGMINLLDAVLPNCPRLESINLNTNQISSLAKLNTLAPMEQPSKIIQFFIDANPVWKSANDADRDALLHFVRSNPELGRLGFTCHFAESDLYTPLTEHYLDLNRSGRILLSGNVSRPGIPLSVWPVVLERANQLFQNNRRRQANALYHLLQGPAFRAPDNSPNWKKRQRRDA